MKDRKNKRNGTTSQLVKAINKESKALDKQTSLLGHPGTECLTWNVTSEATPCMGRTDRLDNKVHNFVQSIDKGRVISSSTSIDQIYRFSATLGDLTQLTTFTSLFDQYRIMAIEAWIVPKTAASAGNECDMATVIDYDDSNTLSGVTDLLQFTNVTLTNANNQAVYRKWRPHIAVANYAGTFTGFTNMASTWIDCASSGTQHYGLKIAIQPSATTINIDLNLRYWVQFRNVF